MKILRVTCFPSVAFLALEAFLIFRSFSEGGSLPCRLLNFALVAQTINRRRLSHQTSQINRFAALLANAVRALFNFIKSALNLLKLIAHLAFQNHDLLMPEKIRSICPGFNNKSPICLG